MTTKKRKIFIFLLFEKGMQTKLLGKVISEIAGNQGSDILQLLVGKKDVNEFLLAKKLNLTINQVRNILYKLANYSLVSFTRKKDKKKGWYTYFWTLDTEKALELLAGKLRKEIKNLEQQLRSRKEKRFYFCKTCKTEVSEETALLHDFSCPECGEIYELADNKKVMNSLEKEIGKLERQRRDVLQELGKIKKEKEKERIKEEKREERKKKKAKKKKKRKMKKKVKKKAKKAAKKRKKKSIKKISKLVKNLRKKKRAKKKKAKKKKRKK